MKKIIYITIMLLFVKSLFFGVERRSNIDSNDDFVKPTVLVLNFIPADLSTDKSYGEDIRVSLYSSISQTDSFYLSNYSSFIHYCKDNTLDDQEILNELTPTILKDLCLKSNSQIILYGDYSIDKDNQALKIEYKTFYQLNNLNNSNREISVDLEKDSIFFSIDTTNEEYIEFFKVKYPLIKKRLIMNVIEKEKTIKKYIQKEVLPVKKYIRQRNTFTIGTALTGTIFITLSIAAFAKLGWYEYQNGTPFENPNPNSNLAEIMVYVGLIIFGSVDFIGLMVFAGMQLRNYIRWKKYGEFTPEQFKEWKRNKRKKRASFRPLLTINFPNKESNISLGLSIKL